MMFFKAGDSKDALYSTCRDKKEYLEIRQGIEDIWADYEPYCGDGPDNFIVEAMKHFNGQVWHLFLANLFQRNGFKLRRTSTGQPDLCIEQNGKSIWVEAVSVTVGNGPDKAPGIEYYSEINGFFQPSDTQIQLRLSNAFDSKYVQLSKNIANGLIGKDDLCVIAVNSGEVLMSGFTPDYSNMFKVLYKVGGTHYSYDRKTHQGQLEIKRRESLIKKSGTSFSVGYFEDPKYVRINGVIFCYESVFKLMAGNADEMEIIDNLLSGGRFLPSFLNCFGKRWIVKNDGMVCEHATESANNTCDGK